MSRMTLSDRIAIEAGIYAHKTLTEIAERIGKSRRHVSEELRKNGTKVSGEHPFGKRCHNATGCKRTGLCSKEGCSRRCCSCREVDCQTICKALQSQPCKQLQKPPYVCNVCTNRRKCKMDRVYYSAQYADAVAKRRYSEARSKPQIQYTMFWVRMLTGFFCLVAGLAVIPLKRQIKAQEANTPELKRIRFVLLVGHGILVLALLLLLPKTIMF